LTYSVGVELEPRESGIDLDGLQRQGVGALLAQGLVAVAGASGPDGIEIEVDDFHVGVHPGGAMLLVAVAAPALEFAEQGTQAMVAEILTNSELLSDWRIVKCEVGLVDELAMESLAAADGPDAPPNDPAERAAMLGTMGEGWVEEEIDVRTELVGEADKLVAFDLATFETEDGEPRVAAGALIYVIEELIDNLFDDVEVLSEEDVSVAETDDVMLGFGGLPPQFAHHYTPVFARQFLVAAVTVTGRLVEPEWHAPGCIAESLALHLLVQQATRLLDVNDLLTGDPYKAFTDAAFDDLSHELLYDPALDGIDVDRPTDVGWWFVPYDGHIVHPYAADEPPAE
jgi:hypothetical protein